MKKEYGVYYPVNEHMKGCVGIELANSAEEAIQKHVKSIGETDTTGFTAEETIEPTRTDGHLSLCTCWFCCPWMYR